MVAEALTPDIRKFLDENIKNYEELQVLLLMHAYPNRIWDVIDVAKDLRIEPFQAAAVLKRLHEGKLINHETACGNFYEYAYTPHPEEKERQISQLAAAFDQARNEIVAYLFSRENKALQLFSDAFRFKKDK